MVTRLYLVPQSLYSSFANMVSIDGMPISLGQFKGNVSLVINVAVRALQRQRPDETSISAPVGARCPPASAAHIALDRSSPQRQSAHSSASAARIAIDRWRGALTAVAAAAVAPAADILRRDEVEL